VFHTLANLPIDCGSINKSLTRRTGAGSASKRPTSASSAASVSMSSLVIGTSTSVVGSEAASASKPAVRWVLRS
jgi:hypothetical protein